MSRLYVTNLPIRLMCLTVCPFICPSACLSTFWFLDSDANTLPLINLKLNRAVGHHLGSVAFEIETTLNNKMAAMAAILKFSFLDTNLKYLTGL